MSQLELLELLRVRIFNKRPLEADVFTASVSERLPGTRRPTKPLSVYCRSLSPLIIDARWTVKRHTGRLPDTDPVCFESIGHEGLFLIRPHRAQLLKLTTDEGASSFLARLISDIIQTTTFCCGRDADPWTHLGFPPRQDHTRFVGRTAAGVWGLAPGK